MADVGVEAFKHNLWANLRLVDVCASLSEDDLAATLPGTYGTVRDTLVHMVGAEGNYLHEFGIDAGERLPVEAPFIGFETLRERSATSGQALLDIAKSQPADLMLKGNYRGEPYEMAASVLLVHAINHSTEHRGHVVAILTQRDVDQTNLRLDGIAYFQAGAYA